MNFLELNGIAQISYLIVLPEDLDICEKSHEVWTSFGTGKTPVKHAKSLNDASRKRDY